MVNLQPEIQPHGPRINELRGLGYPLMLAMWIIAPICWAISCAFFVRQSHLFHKTPWTRLRQSYLIIVCFPLVICTFSLCCLFSVRPAYVWELCQHIYEAFTLLAFTHLLMALLGNDSHRMVQQLQDEPPAKIWAAPPLLCWFTPCVKRTRLTICNVRFIYLLVLQYVFIIPAGGFFRLWMFIDGFNTSPIPGYIGFISVGIAIQGLFMLYRGSKHQLHSYRPTTKFATIKVIVLIGAIQKQVIQAICKPGDQVGVYDNVALAAMWNAFILALECPMFAFAMAYAFPVEELRLYIQEGRHRIPDDDIGKGQSQGQNNQVVIHVPTKGPDSASPADVDLGA